MKTFKDLKVWEKAHKLVLEVYKATKGFPAEEKYGLVSQVRRSASSIPTNIVEGFKRRGDKEFIRFLNIADGSLEETKYHLILARDLEYMNKDEYDRLEGSCEEVGRMLCGLQKTLNSSRT
jgi:four helix bundle protein